MAKRKTALRILSILLSLILVIGLMPLSALAAEGEEPDSAAEDTIDAPEKETAPEKEPETVPPAPRTAEPEPAPAEPEPAEPEQTPTAEPEGTPATPKPAEPAAEPEAAPEPAAPQEVVKYSITYYKNDGYDSTHLRREHAAGDTVNMNEVSFGRDPSFSHDGLEGTRYILIGWKTDKNAAGVEYAVTDTLTSPLCRERRRGPAERAGCVQR